MAQEEHEPPNDTPESEDSEDSTNEDLHVKEVIQQLLQMCELSLPLLHNAVKDILKQHTDVDDSVVEELVRAATKSNVIKFCGKDGTLSTTKRRAAYVNKNFTG
ncbi:hypothetical protein N1851_023092 [Merluccius polli]|uniref:Uncharacterized protein n=1 Tax=Merluccius polli TaxID=89951 RepID=A0AA47NWK8_MERPO|nr:hypothetical protein N1851_023092 [Merluccius polli]